MLLQIRAFRFQFSFSNLCPQDHNTTTGGNDARSQTISSPQSPVSRLFTLILFSFFFLLSNAVGDDWDDYNYGKSADITIAATPLSLGGAVSNFPLLVRVTSSQSNFWGAYTQDDGDDVRFTDSNGDSLAFELERWDNSGQLAEFWVLVPSVGTGNTTITMHWSYPSAVSASQPDKVFATGNNFQGVYHLHNTTSAATDHHKDATSNANHFTTTGTVTQANGIIGKAQQMGGTTSDYMWADVHSSLQITGDVTISTWLYRDNTGEEDWLISHDDSGELQVDNRLYSMIIDTDGSDYVYQHFEYGAGSDAWDTYSYLTTASGAWVHLVMVRDNSAKEIRYFEDGVHVSDVSSYPESNPDGGTDGSLYIGYDLDGEMDETRVSNVERSDDWIELSYETQKASPIVSIGSTTENPNKWSHWAWTSDATSGIDDLYTYTAAHCFGDNHASVTVNNVLFTENFSSSGTGWSISGAQSNWGGNDDAALTGSSEDLGEEFIYAGNPRTVTFTGLISGDSYVATFYSAGWEASGRIQVFAATGGDSRVIDQDVYGNNQGIAISYAYTASGTSQAFTMTPEGGTFHLYAMSNREMNPNIFRPDMISSAVWFDAADATTVTHAGGYVSQWDDKSGNNRDISTGTQGDKPLAGANTIDQKNAFDFDGSDDELLGSGAATWINTTEYTAFAIVKCDVTSSTDYFLGTKESGLDNGLHIGWRDTDSWTLAHYSDDQDWNALTRNTNNNLYTIQFQSPDGDFWINGTSQGAGSNNNPTGDLSTAGSFSVGGGYGNQHWDGLIAEVVIVTGAITAADRERMEGYLAWKWGLEGSLPVAHAWDAEPPPADYIWDGGAADNNWSTAANWKPNGVPAATDNVIFNNTTTDPVELDGNYTVASITSSGYTGTLDFNTNTLTVTGDVDLSGITTVTAGTGTLTFTGTAAQTFTPKSGQTHPHIIQNGAGGTTVATNHLTCREITITSGNFDISANSLNLTTTEADININGGNLLALNSTINIDGEGGGNFTMSSGSFTAPSGTMNVDDDFNISGGTFTHSNGTVVFIDGLVGQRTMSTNGNAFYNLTLNTANDGFEFNDALTVSNTLTLTNGDYDLRDNGHTHTAGSVVITAGNIDFGTGTLQVQSGNVDMSGFTTVTAATGTLEFTATSGTQTYTPKTGQTSPNLKKSGAGGTVLVANVAHTAGTFEITAGTWDWGDNAITHIISSITSSGGTIDFGTNTLQVTGNANLGSLAGITPGTGTLEFTGGSAQTFTPDGATHPHIRQNGAGGTTVATNNLSCNGLTVSSGVFDHSTNDQTVTLADGDLTIDGGTLTSTNANFDFNGADNDDFIMSSGTWNAPNASNNLWGGANWNITGGTFNHNNGLVNMDNGAGSTHNITTNGQAFYDLRLGMTSDQVNLQDALTVTNNLEMTVTNVDFMDNGDIHTIGSLTTPTGGNLDWGTATLNVTTGNGDFSGLSSITPATGTLQFSAGSGTQVFTPDPGATFPAITHTGAGTLQFSTSLVTANSFSNSAGVLDFNGINLTTAASGDFTVTNGDGTTFTGLGGRTITVAGNASFTGQGGDFLNLDPASTWYINATGSLTATLSDIKNSDASGSASEGNGSGSVDLGSNTNWSFGDNYQEDWSYSKSIVMNTSSTGANVAGAVANFPLLVRIVDDVFIDMDDADGGNSIRFENSSGTHLPYEIERWCTSCTPDSAEVWVLVDNVLGNNSSQYITMYWGNASAADSSDPTAVFSTGNNFNGVWHLEEDGNNTAGGYLDASEAANHATGTSMTTSSDVQAVIGNGQDFDGTADYLVSTANIGITGNADRTVSFWVNLDNTNRNGMVGWGTGANDQQYGVAVRADEWFLWGWGGGNDWDLNTTPATNSWVHVAVIHTSGTSRWYVNSTEVQSGFVNTYNTPADVVDIAREVDGSATYMDGTLDEVRISDVARSTDFIKLSYMNQRTDEKLITPEEDYVTGWTYNKNIIMNTSPSGADVAGNVTNFPLLVRLNPGNFTFGEMSVASGGDLRFSDSDGNHLFYEIERWCESCTPDSAEIWVRVPTILGNNSTQYITMHWGEAGVTSQSNPEAVFSAANGFDMSWHLDGLTDATSNNWDLSDNGSTDRVGIIGQGRDFDNGDSAYTASAYDPAINGTINFWFYADNLVSVDRFMGGDDAFEFKYQGTSLNSDIFSSGGSFLAAPVPPAGNWTYVTTTWNSGTGDTKFYINGAEMATGSIAVSDPGSDVFSLGTRTTNNTEFADIVLDEVRISTTERSADWIKLSYMNQRAVDKLTMIEDYTSDWTGSKAIILNTSNSGADVAGAVTEFPVLIRIIDDVEMDMDAALSGGKDIRFANSNGSHLSYEIERWCTSCTPDSAEIWVNVDNIAGNNSTQFITMYWGNSNADSRSDGAGVFEPDNGYSGVWHFNEDGNNDADGYEDATATANHAQGTNMGVGTSDVTGIIGIGQDFDGSSSYMYSSTLSPPTGDFTYSTWVKLDANNDEMLFMAAGATTGNSNELLLEINPDLDWTVNGTGQNGTNTNAQTGGWYHAVMTRSGSSLTLYVNGVSDATATDGTVLDFSTCGLLFGTDSDDGCNGTLGNWFDGVMDEPRVSSEARTADWVKLSYMNQRAVGKLVEFEDYTNWSNSMNIKMNTTASGANTSTTINKFPVLVRLVDDLHIDMNTANNGNSIRFANSSGSHLSYEIERWDGSNAEIWVNVNSISGNNNSQYFTMYWGNANAPSRSDGSGVFEVENGYTTVYHMNDEPNGNVANSLLDATAHNFDANPQGFTAVSLADGNIGQGIKFDDTDDAFKETDIPQYMVSRSQFAISVWSSSPTDGTSKTPITLYDKDNANPSAWSLMDYWGDGVRVWYNGGDIYGQDSSTLWGSGMHHFYWVSRSATDHEMYIDGVSVFTSSTSKTLDAALDEFQIGMFDGGEFHGGVIDEIRVETGSRSDDWAKLSYMNQRAADKLLDIEDYGKWSGRSNITLNTSSTGANVTGSVTDFPVLIRLKSTNFDFSKANADGSDIRFANSIGTHLDYQIESWDNAAKTAEIWVEVDAIAGSNSTQYISMHWGQVLATSRSDPEMTFNTNNNYLGAWHLQDVSDATLNNNDLVKVSGSTGPDDITAQIAGGQSLDGDDYLSAGYYGSIDGTTDFTLSTWIKTSSTEKDYIMQQRQAGSVNGEYMFMMNADGTLQWEIYNAGYQFQITSTGTINDGNWHLITAVRDADDGYLYIDGVQDGYGDGTSALDMEVAFATAIGFDFRDNVDSLTGDLDEIRISTTRRSADWIKLSYMNQRADDQLTNFSSLADYAKSVRFTFNTTSLGLGGSVNNIPMLIRLEPDEVDLSLAQDNGSDILFVDKSGEWLYHELIHWDKGNDTGSVWVKVPTVDATDGDYITMYYGCGSCDATGFAVADSVFSGYAGAWHLAGGETQAVDVTGNGNTGTYQTSQAQHIGVTTPNAASFDGNDDFIIMTDMLDGLGAFTLSGWVYRNGTGTKHDLYGQNDAIEFFITSGNTLRVWTNPTGNLDFSYSGYENGWHHVVATGDGTDTKLYIDGGLKNTDPGVTADYGSSAFTAKIGAGVSTTSGDFFDGRMNEVRFSTTARNVDYIELSYENQRVGSGLIAVNDIEGPVPIPNLELWLKADSGVQKSLGVYAADGEEVQYWNDQTSNNNDASEATTKPTYHENVVNGKPVIRFNGTDDKFVDIFAASTQNKTIFAVFSHDHDGLIDPQGPVWTNSGATTNSGFFPLHTSGGQRFLYTGGADPWMDPNPNGTEFDRNVFSLVTAYHATGLSQIYKNGVFVQGVDDNATQTDNNFNLAVREPATAQYFKGDIAEVLYYDRALDDFERDQVEAYLNRKYALTAPDVVTTLTATTISSGVRLTWTQPVSTFDGVDTVGIWASTTAYPDSSRNGILVGKFDVNDPPTFDWPQEFASTWYFTLLARDSTGRWSNAAISAQDTAVIAGGDRTITYKFDASTLTSPAITGAVANFPMLIRLDANDAAVFETCPDADGTHVRFFDHDAGTGEPQLSYEVEKWNVSATAAAFWVLVPSVADARDSITMVYNGCSNSDASDGTAVFSTGNSFVGVWHLNETSGNINDATGSGNTGTKVGTAPGYSQAGVAGDAIDLPGTDEYFDIPQATVITGANVRTASVWANIHTFNNGGLFDWGSLVAYEEFCLRTMGVDNNFREQFYGAADVDATLASAKNNWRYYTLVFDGANAILYYDGIQDNSTARALNTTTTGALSQIGRYNNTELDGVMDEMRLSNTNRSADWIRLSYESQKPSTDFFNNTTYEQRIYVDAADGDDNNSCGAAEDPSRAKKTVTSANACVAANYVDTMRIVVMPGTYTDSLIDGVTGYETMVMAADPNNPPVFNGYYDETIDKTLKIQLRTHLRNLTLKAGITGAYAIRNSSNSDYVTVIGCRIVNDGSTTHAVGINVNGATAVEHLIANNVIIGATSDGILVSSADDVNVINNVIYGPTTNGFRQTNGAAADITVTNNIFMNLTTGISTADADIGLVSHNLFHNVVTQIGGAAPETNENAVTGDPQFVSTDYLSANAFKLSPGSPAIDAGTESLTPSTSFGEHAAADYWGTARPVGSVRDIGVYEGQGFSGDVLLSELDSLIVTSDATTVTVENANWKIVFDETLGGGIKFFYDKGAPSTNLLSGTTPLFDVSLESDYISTEASELTVLSKNWVHAQVQQFVDYAARDYTVKVIYNIYASGHIYVQSEITNTAGDQTNDPLIFKMEMDAATSEVQQFSNNSSGETAKGYGYLLSNTRDAFLSASQDLDLLGDLIFVGDTATDIISFSSKTGNHLDLNGSQKVRHYFVMYIGDQLLTADKAASINSDTYNPAPLTVNVGTLTGESSWQDFLVGQWSMDEGTGTSLFDLSYLGRTGTITGATWTTGKRGGGLDFASANDRVTIAHNTDFDVTPGNGKTMMIWANIPSTPGAWGNSESEANLFSKWDTGTNGWELKRKTGTNQIMFKVGQVTTLVDPDPPPYDEWIHIAGVVKGTGGYLYVNGVLKAVEPSLVLAANSDAVEIGDNQESNRFFEGQLDDARIYSMDAHEEFIQAVYNQGFSEKSGNYKVRANNNNRAIITMNTAAAATRFQPAFEVDNWYGGAIPKYVYVDGVQMTPYVDFISVTEPKIVANVNMGNKLEIQFNRTFVDKNVDIFIDNDDSTGFMGASALMPTLTVSATDDDKITLQNFSGSILGEADSKEWYLELDLDGDTDPTDTDITTKGFGSFNVWNSAAISPGVNIANARQLAGVYTVSGTQLIYIALRQQTTNNVVFTGNGGYAGPAEIGHTWNDSSSVRISVTLDQMTLMDETVDTILVTKTFTVYPTGRIFASYKIEDVDLDLGDQVYIRAQPRYDAQTTSAWSSTYVQNQGVWGIMGGGDDFHSLAGAVMSVNTGAAAVTAATSLFNAYTEPPYNTGGNDAIQTRYRLAAGLSDAVDDDTEPLVYNFMLDISTDFADSATADSLSRDVRNPATIAVNGAGNTVTDDPLDFNTDGFAEGEGAYTYEASANIAQFKFTLTNNVPQVNPAFKIKEWNSGAPPAVVIVNNQEQIRGYTYNASVSEGNLIIQFNQVWTENKEVYIALKTALAVTMNDSDFVAISAVGVDSLKWTTHSEINNLGFKVKRRVKPGQEGASPRDTVYKYMFKKLIPGAKGGRSSADIHYVWVDKTAVFGVMYEYILVAYDFNGNTQEFGPREASPLTPLVTKLYGNYPNPFNPSTTIRFDLATKSKLALNIYNIKGQLIRRLITPNKALQPGQYRYQWDARNDNGVDVPTGHYLLFFVTKDGYKKARKMTLLK